MLFSKGIKSLWASALRPQPEIAALVPRAVAEQGRFILEKVVLDQTLVCFAVEQSHVEAATGAARALMNEVPFRRRLANALGLNATETAYLQPRVTPFPDEEVVRARRKVYGDTGSFAPVAPPALIQSSVRNSASFPAVTPPSAARAVATTGGFRALGSGDNFPLATLLTRGEVEQHLILIKEIADRKLVVHSASANGWDWLRLQLRNPEFRQRLAATTSLPAGTPVELERVECPVGDIERRLDNLFPRNGGTGIAGHEAKQLAAQMRDFADSIGNEETPAEDPREESRTENTIRRILQSAFHANANDCLLRYDFLNRRMDVEFVIDGRSQFQPPLSISPGTYRLIINHLAKMAQIGKFKPLGINDGKLQISLGTVNKRTGQEESFAGRVSISPVDIHPLAHSTENGFQVPMACIRILRGTQQLRTLDDIGLTPFQRRDIDFIRRKTKGLFLMCGPTGSGKSDTLLAVLNENLKEDPSLRIRSVEDPVETWVERIDQTTANTGAGMKMSDYLRAALRSAPQQLFMGEIRDEESAFAAISAAQTGHLTFASVHASDPFEVVARLRGFEVDAGDLKGNLVGVGRQYLLPRLCDTCKRPDYLWRERIRRDEQLALNLRFLEDCLRDWGYHLDESEIPAGLSEEEELRHRQRVFRPFTSDGTINGEACPHCRKKTGGEKRGSGARGRVAALEIWNAQLQRTQLGKVDSNVLVATALRLGHRTLWFEAVSLIQRGLVSLEGAVSKCENIDPVYEGLEGFDIDSADGFTHRSTAEARRDHETAVGVQMDGRAPVILETDFIEGEFEEVRDGDGGNQ